MPSPIQIADFVEPQFAENAYVVWTRNGGPCWIIDPGLPPSAAGIIRHIESHGLTPERLILTHAHTDHIAGIPEILRRFSGLPVRLAEIEHSFFTDPNENGSAWFGVPITVRVTDPGDILPGEPLMLDGTTWLVTDTSGHSPGGRSFYSPDAGLVIAGDALFHRSIGRTDFPHSDHDQLIRNIHANLLTLPDETRVYSGHGPVTTIGEERRFNPFLS